MNSKLIIKNPSFAKASEGKSGIIKYFHIPTHHSTLPALPEQTVRVQASSNYCRIYFADRHSIDGFNSPSRAPVFAGTSKPFSE